MDTGSRYTGIASVREIAGKSKVTNLFQLNHRGLAISESLRSRRAMRNRRRGNLRYRAARFNNRTKPKGWLAPSLQHRVDSIMNWVGKLQRLMPITSISQELVRFDMQLMNNQDINGTEYQQGELQGYEVREYLLEKWGRQCVYCDIKNVPLEIEHIIPKSRGGSNRISNLTLACKTCNQQKGCKSIEVFLAKKPELLKRILTQTKSSLKDAAAVNSTRWKLANNLKATGLPIELSSGGRTKFNRIRHGIPKSHALDAACVGEVNSLENWAIPTLEIKCTGRGRYQRTKLDKYGFPNGYCMRQKAVKGFQTGDQVIAHVTNGKKVGTYKGRISVRATGFFNIHTKQGVIQGIGYKYCRLISRNDGYGYIYQPKIA
jgi:5-methylcytosine-specific restriction endonuclease McrA